MVWQCRNFRLSFGLRPLILGILNVTPDSFSDGGQFPDPGAAVERGLRMISEGSDILDIGGESTRPGATPVPLDEELRRVVPVVRELAKYTAIPLSIDTMKAEVARQALDVGAAIVNDVSGLRRDLAMPGVCADSGAGAIVMHMQGDPQTMHLDPAYDDVVNTVGDYFAERIRTLTEAGIPLESLCLDPGIGFGKRTVHNLSLLARLGEFQRFNRPVCLGVSRKRFYGDLCGRETHDRLAGSLAVASFAVAAGAAQLLRVHDIPAHRDAAVLWEAIRSAAP
ncbi:MAG TPA: dihydropteroate synthase [Fimbriiglobus sp.]|jgi:dihydropteroate synthase